jgi:hypothetical protein
MKESFAEGRQWLIDAKHVEEQKEAPGDDLASVTTAVFLFEQNLATDASQF